MQRLQLYITETHASVTICNGASRETSANTVSQMLNAMPAEDLQTLIMFCAAIVAYGRQGATGVNSLIGR